MINGSNFASEITMTIIKFQTREERAFAELVEEGKKLEGQGFFVITEDDEKAKLPDSANIVAFPAKDSVLDIFDSEREEDLELAARVMERQNNSIIEIDLDDLL
ncbi:hypothetical protein [Candidatus Nitrotoga sp. M5]|jgi:hypothetical protein|uniref:hypothetical protein n=1 Tax=Candidatus Nitrotoga sp. M5 TaxID=2890409 RepID=UPI001EF4B0DB|nr:hypothetical protein [Candidatus Nitrotoga sp. M5]CAH1388309.1 conserved hypothetical protein [Candidatus Nitrotoga sp. M5]